MADNNLVRVGSRKSQLALIQTNFVVDQLKKLRPEITFEIVSMSTIGDKVLDRALSKIGEKSLFTKELEIALEQKLVDFVVHSLKDLPTSLPDGMAIASVLQRDDPRDAVVFHPKHQTKSLQNLPPDSVVGTSSLRRVAQLKRKFPSLKFENIRGNLNTRLKKLDEADQYDAIVLAKAGLTRMNWDNRIDQVLEPETECMYAISQGALGVECRSDDSRIINLLSELSHTDTLLRCVAERAFLKKLEGGCTVPIATYTNIVNTDGKNKKLTICGGIFSLDGHDAVTSSNDVILLMDVDGENATMDMQYAGIIGINVPRKHIDSAEFLGRNLALECMEMGAKTILDKAKEEHKSEQAKLNSENQGTPKWSNLDAN